MKRGGPLRRKPKPAKPLEYRAHLARVAKMPCLVCGGAATVHHVTGWADRMGRLPRDDRRVVPLCPRHHQAVWDSANYPVSVEQLGHRGFYEKHGLDLLAEADRLWKERPPQICPRKP